MIMSHGPPTHVLRQLLDAQLRVGLVLKDAGKVAHLVTASLHEVADRQELGRVQLLEKLLLVHFVAFVAFCPDEFAFFH